MSDDNGQAPLGSMLVEVGSPDKAGEPAGQTVKSAPDAARPAPSAPAAPSWGRVLATTISLWLRRRWQVVAAVVVAAAIAVTALAVSGVFSSAGGSGVGPRPVSKTSSHRATPKAATPQAAAAVWVASQVSDDAIIACDPTSCAALQAQGVSAGRLMPMNLAAPDPQGAAVVVSSSTSQAISQYAPAIVASFGSGLAQIDVRAAEPSGVAAYQAALQSDLAAREAAGTQLLKNTRIKFTASDAVQLRAGQVDARVLATLAALASQHSFTVVAFGDAAPGAATLYRAVTVTSNAASNTAADLAADLALVKAQVQPYLPAQAAIVHTATGQDALSAEFSAPNPLGLLTAVLDVARAAG